MRWFKQDTFAVAALVVAAAVVVGVVVGWMFDAQDSPAQSEHEIISTSKGTFLVDRTYRDTGKRFVSRGDAGEPESMGWRYRTKPVRNDTAAMENMEHTALQEEGGYRTAVHAPF